MGLLVFWVWIAAGVLAITGGVLDDLQWDHTASAFYTCAAVLSILNLLVMAGIAEEAQDEKNK